MWSLIVNNLYITGVWSVSEEEKVPHVRKFIIYLHHGRSNGVQ